MRTSLAACPPSEAELSAIVEQIRRESGSLRQALSPSGMTRDQRAALEDTHSIVVIEGGNRAGKTRTSAADVASFALNIHPTRKWLDAPQIWYCSVSFDLFSQGAWPHLLNFLLLPDESIHRLPSTYIERVDWIRPGVPHRVTLVNGAEITVKSYEQGPAAFQAAQLDLAVIDEECHEPIWRELRARFMAATSPHIIVAATPILGVEWLGQLRRMAEERAGDVAHYRLRTLDNPSHNPQWIAGEIERYRDRPEELRLRLEGIPYFAQGLVYPDELWRPIRREVEPWYVEPGRYTVCLGIDPGWRYCAAVWVAITRDDSEWLVIQDYMGRERTVEENAHAIQKMSAQFGGRIERTLIDPHAAQRHLEERGKRIVDLYREHGIKAVPWLIHEVEAGIQRVSDLLSERGPNGEMRMRVFKTCENVLRERRSYRRRAQREEGDEGKENPVKADDHCMDVLRGMYNTGLRFRTWTEPEPPAGTMAREYWNMHHPEPTERL